MQVVVTNQHKGAAAGSVALYVPRGWTVTPATAALSFTREDEESTTQFQVTAPAAAPAGDYAVTARVSDPAGTYDTGYDVVEYAHTQRRHVPRPATARIKVIDVSVAPNTHVGYVMGVGDQVPQALSQLGARVDLITPEQLASGDLSQYTAIVTGVRAYERRADLRANNKRLLDYAAAGGTVLVQYNKFEFNEAQYGPYPAKVVVGRVTDENAPIEVLAALDPVFSAPNSSVPRHGAAGCRSAACISSASATRATSTCCRPPIPSSTTAVRRPARLSKRVSAGAAGSTLASGCGASCPRAPSAPTASWPI